MKKNIFFFFLLVGFTQVMNAQVKIGGDVTTKADPSAVLELQSTTMGLLLPLIADPANDIAEPAKGLLVYNTTLNAVQVNVGTPTAPQWVVASVSVGTTSGTTGRPAAPPVGMIRFNTTNNSFEGWNGSGWVAFTTTPAP